MPTIYDNIENPFVDGLRGMLANSRSADFCVGYFNLRGWKAIAADVEQLPNGCRLLIGMTTTPKDMVRRAYNSTGEESRDELTQRYAAEEKKKAVMHFAKQLTYGCPTAEDERNLRKLAQQLRSGKVQVKFHARYPLHAKLYLIHRQDSVAALTGIIGSSNLTLSGLQKNGELNIDVVEQDAAKKLAKWFEDRWNDDWSMDVGEHLIEAIETSWANGPVPPYHVYLKTAWHLSQDAVNGAEEYPLPRMFRGKMLDFQAKGVELAAALLKKRDGVIIGDVVGLGKTIIASAVAKTFQEKESDSVLIICPPKLEKMWKGYMHDYLIAGAILPHSKLKDLKELRRFKLLIVDESHNFRNRDSRRFAYLRDYIAENDSRVVLLTATPYNKAFTDIASQLRLFINPDTDLGIRPDNMLRKSGGATRFFSDHPNTPPSSLSAFEKSEEIDDWRELMRLFMVRRTRAHIKEHYAEFDEDKKRHYLLFSDGGRFYFPKREPKCLAFPFAQQGSEGDDYAKLYSQEVVDIIGDLSLPRYGLTIYLREGVAPANPEDKQVIENLTRAGPRLRGFTRSGLFKRLESGGDAFLLSIDRHILRNNIHLVALADADGALPIGQINLMTSEEAAEEIEADIVIDDVSSGADSSYTRAKQIYRELRQESAHKYSWVSRDYFDKPLLSAALQADVDLLEEIRELVPKWQADTDRKLRALFELVQNTHGEEKVLVFSQYKDTVDYLYRELKQMGVDNLAAAHGGSENIQELINRFSPCSNDNSPSQSDIRVLVTTDALSEGQNLQDAHIVVNYDLPWALIRLVQRVGRVDRIGQKSDIYCYSAMPEEGIERIITLRTRLQERMKQNEELIGSDERFFEGDEATDRRHLQGLYDGTASLEEEDETDLISRAYDIWRQAEKENPQLAAQIRKLPDVVYSAKPTKATAGVVVYVQSGRGHDILAHIDGSGKIISQAQAQILDMLKCAPDDQPAAVVENHHDLVLTGVKELESNAVRTYSGQLGGRRSIRRQLYYRLGDIINNAENTPLLFSREEMQQLRQARQLIYDYSPTETARGIFRRLLKNGESDEKLQKAVIHLQEQGNLCFVADDGKKEAHIICSMGLVK